MVVENELLGGAVAALPLDMIGASKGHDAGPWLWIEASVSSFALVRQAFRLHARFISVALAPAVRLAGTFGLCTVA